jgi:acyl-CoA synthetase (AMP-forming)/AMP-acid ligase II
VFAGASLVELLRFRSAVQPLAVAYTFLRDGEQECDSITYATLDMRSRAIAAQLQRRCRPGDRALLLYQPGLEFISAFFGCLYAGVVAVPASPPNLTRSDRALPRLRAIAIDAQPTLVLSTLELVSSLTRAAAATDTLKRLADSDAGAAAKTGAIAGILGSEWITTDTIPDDDAGQWRDLVARPGTLAFLQYTSGSTATPKGVMITHGNVLHNLAYAFYLGDGDTSSVSVSWLPVIHDMGLIEGVLQPAFSGGHAYLMSPAAFLQRPVRWLNAVSRYGAIRSGGPNFAYDLCARRIGPQERLVLNLSSWRSAYCGAEPVRQDTLRTFIRAFAASGFTPSAFRPCYGLAEATLLVTAGRWKEGESERDSEQLRVGCGNAAFDTQVLIVEPEHCRPCAPGDVGEIWVSGPSIARGYWNRPDETTRMFHARTDTGRGPFLRTGDLGCLDDGNLYVTGRLKDVLIVRGMKHYPQDLERTAEQHPIIRPGCTAAFATENGLLGDRIAIVAEADVRQLKVSDVAEATILAIRRSIAERHGVLLEAVALVPPGSIPKTTSGKLQRFACREAYLSDSLPVLAIWRESGREGERCA